MSNNINIRFDCPQCVAPVTLTVQAPCDHTEFPCPECKQEIKLMPMAEDEIHGCPACQCRDIYQNKDFNRTVGMGIFFAGVILSFAFSLIWIFIALLIDVIVYPFYPWVITCYKCACEVRGYKKQKHLDRFQHEIGGSYEYRNEKQKNNKPTS